MTARTNTPHLHTSRSRPAPTAHRVSSPPVASASHRSTKPHPSRRSALSQPPEEIDPIFMLDRRTEQAAFRRGHSRPPTESLISPARQNPQARRRCHKGCISSRARQRRTRSPSPAIIEADSIETLPVPIYPGGTAREDQPSIGHSPRAAAGTHRQQRTFAPTHRRARRTARTVNGTSASVWAAEIEHCFAASGKKYTTASISRRRSVSSTASRGGRCACK